MCCLVGCGTIAEITIGVEALVALLQGCSDDLLKIGAGAVVSFDVQLNIAACLAAVITVSMTPSLFYRGV